MRFEICYCQHLELLAGNLLVKALAFFLLIMGSMLRICYPAFSNPYLVWRKNMVKRMNQLYASVA
jgi:hypothetical protein